MNKNIPTDVAQEKKPCESAVLESKETFRQTAICAGSEQKMEKVCQSAEEYTDEEVYDVTVKEKVDGVEEKVALETADISIWMDYSWFTDRGGVADCDEEGANAAH